MTKLQDGGSRSGGLGCVAFTRWGPNMRRRVVDPPTARRFFHGRYLSELEYLAAVAARDERRARLSAHIYAQRGWDTDDDVEDW